MGKGYLYIASFLVVLFLGSCNTYETFYQNTYTSLKKANVRKVVRLDLSTSKEEVKVDAIKSLDKIRMLDLTSKTVRELALFLDHLPNPEVLQVLIIDSLDLTELPLSLKKFTGLRQLSINYNNKLDLEQVISVCKELPIEFLNLQYLCLKEIPESMADLRQLKDLNLSYNNLSNFDHYVRLATLPDLTSLWLTGNELKQFPESLGSLEQLAYLYVEHNRLSSVPEAITGMKNVTVVHAGYNAFTELPENFGRMPKLLLLHINNNSISTIPDFYLKKGNYGMLGLVFDKNKLDEKTKRILKKAFDHFFIFSM